MYTSIYKKSVLFKLFFKKKKKHLETALSIAASISRLLTIVSEQKGQNCTETGLKRIRVKLILDV